MTEMVWVKIMSEQNPLRTYTQGGLNSMNAGYPWNGTIRVNNTVPDKKNTGLFELHATWDCDLNGRRYQALPKGIKITEAMKRKFNFM